MPTIDRRTAASIATLAALAFLCWFAIGCGRDDDQSTGEPNAEATLAAVVTEISATQEAASQGATPAPATTDAPRLSSTTEGFTPSRTPLTNAATGSDPLTLLPITDSESFLAGVSETERTCLSEEVSPDQLTALASSPELVTDEERLALIGCLEDDTMLRLFLTPVLTATGPLR